MPIKSESEGMMTVREVPKIPETPPLTSERIKLLTKLCFREDHKEVQKVDLFFIFGSAICFEEMAKEIRKGMGFSDILLLTGGVEKYFDSPIHELPESVMLYEILKKEIPPKVQVLCEMKSRNTFENLRFGLDLLEKKPRSICYLAKSFHSGRAYLTMRKFLPQATLYQRSFNPIYPNCKVAITQENWFKDKEYSARVWGEFLRIKKYGERGDLALHEVEELIASIDRTFS